MSQKNISKGHVTVCYRSIEKRRGILLVAKDGLVGIFYSILLRLVKVVSSTYISDSECRFVSCEGSQIH